jgi:type IV pilus assembly protein PilW
LIESDVRMASFWGLHNRPDLVTINAAAVFPAGCGATWVTDVTKYVTGQNNAYALPCPASGGGASPGTDVLILRRASSQRMSPQTAIIPSSDRTRILIVSSRLSAQIFVPRDIGNALPAGYATADPVNAPPLADTREMLVHAYYVSRDSTVAAGYPALRRKRLTSGPAITDEELLPGVEDLQFQIGVDMNGDDNADSFINPGPIPVGGRPVSVRLWLRLRAPEIENGYVDGATYAYADENWTAPGDSHRRLVLQKTVRLRNARP